MQNTNKSERIPLYLPQPLAVFLKKEAEKQKRSTNNLIFVVLSRFKEETEASARILAH
jgi:hypothetical protein